MGGSSYFVTFRTKGKVSLPAKGRDEVLKTIKYDHGRKYELSVAVVMPDHVHLISSPLPKDNGDYFSLGEILRVLKGVSARKVNLLLNRRGAFWQDESFDRIIMDEDEWREKCEYIQNNPVKSALVERPEDYNWLVIMEARY